MELTPSLDGIINKHRIMTEKQIGIVSHSLGINYYNAKLSTDKKYKFLPDEFYRNYYNYAEFDSDMIELEKLGIIEKYTTLKLTCFSVTDKGILIFREIFKTEITDKYTPVSKAKMKYMEYLHDDTGLTFAEYNGIWCPKKEFDRKGLIRYVSTKYSDVKGEYCLSHKEAKVSYKNALSLKNKSIRDNRQHVKCRLY